VAHTHEDVVWSSGSSGGHCPTIAIGCQLGYAPVDTDGDGCLDSCQRMTCPPTNIDCAQGYTPGDSNGDGCIDTCILIPPGKCGPIAIDCAPGSGAHRYGWGRVRRHVQAGDVRADQLPSEYGAAGHQRRWVRGRMSRGQGGLRPRCYHPLVRVRLILGATVLATVSACGTVLDLGADDGPAPPADSIDGASADGRSDSARDDGSSDGGSSS
jgi:hypothetical protein